MFEITDIINMAIQIQRNAENICRSAQRKISNRNLSMLPEWLAEEEVEHAKWFRWKQK